MYVFLMLFFMGFSKIFTELGKQLLTNKNIYISLFILTDIIKQIT